MDSTGDVDNDGSLDKKSSETGIAIDKISTMSLGEFKSLLNSALSVPHTAGSQCSSDSPRSQSSVDSTRNNSMTQNRKTAANKSVHTYKPGGANRTISNMEKSNTLPRTKSASLDCSSSGYSSSSVASDKSKKSSANSYSPTTNSASPTYARTSVSRPKTPSSDSPKVSRAATSKSNLSNKQSVHSSTGVSSSPRSQTKQQGSAYKTRSQSSLNSDTSNRLNTATVPSRSSSQSSFKSYDSITEEDPYDPSDLRSVNSDNYLPKYNGALESPSAVNYISNGGNHVPTNYTRSNSYTPSAAAADKAKWAEPRNETRANSEPREVVKSEPMSDMQPLNVGYASFSHQEQNVNSPGILSPTYKFDEELSKIESELKKYENNDDDISDEMNFHEEKSVSKTHSLASQLPTRRPSTPSLIPRPATPKMTRKLSLTQGDEEYAVAKQTDNKGRPPTPKKSNIIARANSGTSSLKATDSSKEKTYKDIFQSKRSTTPGPGNVSTNPVTDNARRCTTPCPTMSRTSSLSTTSATVSRDRLNQTLEKNRDAPLSVFDDSKNSGQSVKAKTNSGGVIGRRHSVDSRSFNKESSSKEPETVIMVNRSGDGHSLTVKDQAKPQTKPSANRPNVLARARTEDARSRPQTRTNTGISRQRPQSVEPRQLIPRSKNTSDSNEQNGALSVQRGEDGNYSIYNRTQEWVQTAAEQTSKVQKTKVMKQVNPKVRRAMTPNSFHKRIDQEEPRSLDEIKAALTLPINGLTKIEIDAENLDAPPEDPEMYATMEKLFNELRKQELKASVNETPGSNVTPAKSSKSKSKSSGSMNDEEASLDSNKNIKHKKLSLSTSSSNVTSPTVPQKKASVNSNVSQPSYGRQPSRTSSTSSVSANPSTSASRSTQPSTPRSTPPRATPPRTASTPRSDPPRPASPSRNMSVQPQRPSSPSMNRSVQPQRPSSPSMNRSAQPARPSSPSMNRSAQLARPSSPSMNRSAQPVRPSSPSMNTPAQPPRPSSPSMNRSFQSPRPASPRTTVSTQPSKPPVQRPASPRTTSTQSSRSSVPASPRSQPESKVSCTQQSTSHQTPRQPPRPASTPPRPSTPVGRTSSSRARDDTESSQNNGTVAASSLLSKIKEIIKVKPRKDKAEGVKQKSRIPAPKSLANAGKSRSFTNLGSIGRSMTLPNTKANGHLDYSDFDGDMNGMDYESDINGGLNVTMSGRNETPKLKMAMPLTTGRATVIRKESIEKNRNPPRLTRAVSVERNMGGLASDFQFYREGEYV